MKRFFFGLSLAILLGLLLSSHKLSAQPILASVSITTDVKRLAYPESVLHDRQSDRREAEQIINSWKTEPVTVAWTRLQLQRYVKHKMMPTRGARGLALMHVAMYDAHEQALVAGLDTQLAVSMAAAKVLSYLYVVEERSFDRIAFSVAGLKYQTSENALPDTAKLALQLGFQVGQAIVGYAELDGAQKGWNGLRLQWYGQRRYYAPGTWEPTPPYFYFPPDEPFAPQWRPWVLSPASEFRPSPPAFGSPQYVKDLEEVVNMRDKLTDAEQNIARFWVDGHGSVTPPGHWNNIAIDEVLKAKLDERTTARLFAHMNIALADTFIAVWDTKYHHWTARPVSVTSKLLGIDFKPLLLTPPFPSYVSGHAGFSGAAAKVIGAYLPARAQALDAMAEEAAYSRLLGGIHFRHDNEDGLILGRKVADKVLQRFLMKK
jgi:hypothetical protein